MGDIDVSGMKNAAVPVILSTVLLDDVCTLENLPNILDVSYSLEILQSMGATVKRLDKNTVTIDTRHVRGGSSPYDLVRKMRGSYYIMGAELGRFGCANVGCPGGCDFGVRPIDQHIKGFRALGAQVNVDGGYLEAKTPNGLHAAHLFFDKVSVGATINVIIAATRAKGTTVIENAAREPHVVDLANFLNSCGARISGAGTDVIKIRGVDRLYGCTYAIIPDMIEAGTYMIAAAATKGRLHIRNVIPKHLESISAKLEEMGAQIEEFDDSILVTGPASLRPTDVRTQPYPGLPTDVHPQLCVLLCLAQGVSYLTEGVWDNRFRYVEELKRMGAQIKVDGKMAIVEGGEPLSAAPIQAVDLRAGAAVVIAALTANGKSEIENIYHIERGYENVVGKFKGLGANICRIAVEEEPELAQAL